MGFIRADFRLKITAFTFIIAAIFVLYGGVLYSNLRLKPSLSQIQAAQSSPEHQKRVALCRLQLSEANLFELRCILVALFLLLLGMVFLQMLVLHKHDRSHLVEAPALPSGME